MISMNMAKKTCEQTQRVTTKNFRPRHRSLGLCDQRLASFVLTSTPCHFGGERFWLICTAIRGGSRCGRRVGILYLVNDEYACRVCHDLAYMSQQRNHVGSRAFCGKFYQMESVLERGFMDMRIKNWRSNPTKRFNQWLKRSAQQRMRLPQFVYSELKMLGAFKSPRRRR